MAIEKIKNSQGITLTMLGITVMIMFIVAGVSLNAGFSVINDMRVGRIISYMKLVQAKVQIINENYTSYNYDTDYLVGEGPYKINNIDDTSISKNEIKLIADKSGVDSSEVQKWDWYKWDSDDLIQQNLDKNMLGDNEYFYVNYEHAEIIYSVGTMKNNIKYYSMTGLSEGFKNWKRKK